MTKEELLAAWPRVRLDMDKKAFVDADVDQLVIEANLDQWCQETAEMIATHGHRPSAMEITNVPKGKGAVRPGSILSLVDRCVFTAVVSRFRVAAETYCQWSQGRIDVGYELLGPTTNNWFRSTFQCWKKFSEVSVSKARDASCTHVVFADIAGFYECISHERLYHFLRQIGCDNNDIQIVRAYLDRWCPLGRGLPQACSASDLLAKIYVTAIDQALQQEGLHHLRYVDDIRIFCTSEVEAAKSVERLTELLRQNGLILQSAKLKIVPCDEAIGDFEGAQPIIEKVKQDLVDAALEANIYSASASPGLSYEEMKELVAADISKQQELRATFDKHIDGNTSFDKSLFHYLAGKLGDLEDRHAVTFSKGLLATRPEETKFVMDYLLDVVSAEELIAIATEFLISEWAIYHYQNYEVLRAVAAAGNESVSEPLMEVVRRWAQDANTPAYLQRECVRALGIHANGADLEWLISQLEGKHDVSLTADLIFSIRAVEAGRRNKIYAQLQRSSPFLHRTCQAAKVDH